jgi:hypothetical protein
MRHALPEMRGDFHYVGRRSRLVAILPIFLQILSCCVPTNAPLEDFLKHIFNAGLVPFVHLADELYFACAEQCGFLITGGSEI